MKLLFMGSAAFAVPSLVALTKGGHEIITVVTQPDKPAGRGRKLTSPPVAQEAKELGLTLYQPKSVRSEKVINKISDLSPELIVVVAYGKILPGQLLEIPPKDCVNVHASLLPKYRGAAPINWAIVNGEKTTGITTMFINERMDAGDILLQEEVEIGEEETSIALHDRLAEIGAKLLLKTIIGIGEGKITPRPQEEKKATLAPLLKKEDGYINWRASAASIRNLVRGMLPWPTAHCHLEGKLLKIFDVTVLEMETAETPGTIITSGDELVVATGKETLRLNEIQLEGKRRIKAQDFLCGHQIKQGTLLE